METQPLLSFEPLELCFPFELNKQLSSSIRLFNKTDDYVHFQLLSTNPRNYVIRPTIGILSPRSTCDIAVTTLALREAPPTMRCKDEFMIRSAVATLIGPLIDGEAVYGMPTEWKLKVVYGMPTESSLGTSVKENSDSHVHEATQSVMEPHDDDLQFDKENSSDEECEVQVVYISDQENNRYHIGKLILRGIVSAFLVLVSIRLMKPTLSWIWSLAMIGIMLVIKMIKKYVSDSVEDWIVKTLLQICLHILFGRKDNNISLS